MRRQILVIYVISVCSGSGAAFAQSSPTLQITSPSAMTTVSPGQAVSITVNGTPADAKYSEVYVQGEAPLGSSTSSQSGMPPFKFTLIVPTVIRQRPYYMTAKGLTVAGQEIESSPSVISVVDQISVSTMKVQPQILQMGYVGDHASLLVFATFADGSTGEIAESPRVEYSTTTTGVVTVSPIGQVVAVGAGVTNILVKTGAVTSTVPVSVPNSIPGDLNGDGKVDIDDINILNSYLNTPAIGPNDARDLNHDGKIDALDARILTTLCTYSRCATTHQ